MDKNDKYKKVMKAMKRGEEACNAYGFRNKQQKDYIDIRQVKAPTLLYGCLRMLELLGYEWSYSQTDKGTIARLEVGEND